MSREFSRFFFTQNIVVDISLYFFKFDRNKKVKMRLDKILLFLLVLSPYAVIKSQSCPSIKDALGNSDVCFALSG